jgi:hypothetical protein
MRENKLIPNHLARKATGQRRHGTTIGVGAKSRNAWNDVLEKIRVAKSALDVRDNEDWWYRGQSSAHHLVPSLFRLLNRGFNVDENGARSIFQLEYDLFFEFSCRAPGMQDPGLTGWDRLAHMRHHGLPTRLLDWTERLGVAIFFAIQYAKDHANQIPVIWILAPCRLNELTIADRDLYSPRYLGYDWKAHRECDYEDYLVELAGKFDWDGPIAIYPPQKNPRMRSQYGWFTIFGERTAPLEEQLPQVVNHVEIPLEAIPAAEEFLLEAGIDSASIFPDLDGFAAYLKEHYEIPRP